jgi:hypothetical protein
VSIPVDVADLADAVAEQARFAYLLTVSDDGHAHVVAITPVVANETITCEAGDRTCANARSRDVVTLVWPPGEPDGYSLIVDGAASVEGSRIAITPERAVRHRPAP